MTRSYNTCLHSFWQLPSFQTLYIVYYQRFKFRCKLFKRETNKSHAHTEKLFLFNNKKTKKIIKPLVCALKNRHYLKKEKQNKFTSINNQNSSLLKKTEKQIKVVGIEIEKALLLSLTKNYLNKYNNC